MLAIALSMPDNVDAKLVQDSHAKDISAATLVDSDDKLVLIATPTSEQIYSTKLLNKTDTMFHTAVSDSLNKEIGSTSDDEKYTPISSQQYYLTKMEPGSFAPLSSSRIGLGHAITDSPNLIDISGKDDGLSLLVDRQFEFRDGDEKAVPPVITQELEQSEKGISNPLQTMLINSFALDMTDGIFDSVFPVDLMTTYEQEMRRWLRKAQKKLSVLEINKAKRDKDILDKELAVKDFLQQQFIEQLKSLTTSKGQLKDDEHDTLHKNILNWMNVIKIALLQVLCRPEQSKQQSEIKEFFETSFQEFKVLQDKYGSNLNQVSLQILEENDGRHIFHELKCEETHPDIKATLEDCCSRIQALESTHREDEMFGDNWQELPDYDNLNRQLSVIQDALSESLSKENTQQLQIFNLETENYNLKREIEFDEKLILELRTEMSNLEPVKVEAERLKKLYERQNKELRTLLSKGDSGGPSSASGNSSGSDDETYQNRSRSPTSAGSRKLASLQERLLREDLEIAEKKVHELKDYKQLYVVQSKRLTELEKRLQQLHEQRRSDFEKELQIRKKLDTAHDTIRRLEDLLKNAQVDEIETKDALWETQSQLSILEEEREERELSLNEELKETKEQLTQSMQVNDDLKTQIDELEGAIQRKSSDLNEAKDTIDQLEEVKMSLTETLTTTLQQLDEATQDLNTTRGELLASKDEMDYVKQDLTREKEVATEEIDVLRHSYAELNRLLSEKEIESGSLAADIAKYQQDYAKFRDKDFLASDMEREIDDLREILLKTQHEFHDYFEEAEEIKADLNHQLNDQQAKIQQLQQVEDKIVEVENKSKAIEQKNDDYKQQVDKMQNRADQLQQKLDRVANFTNGELLDSEVSSSIAHGLSDVLGNLHGMRDEIESLKDHHCHVIDEKEAVAVQPVAAALPAEIELAESAVEPEQERPSSLQELCESLANKALNSAMESFKPQPLAQSEVKKAEIVEDLNSTIHSMVSDAISDALAEMGVPDEHPLDVVSESDQCSMMAIAGSEYSLSLKPESILAKERSHTIEEMFNPASLEGLEVRVHDATAVTENLLSQLLKSKGDESIKMVETECQTIRQSQLTDAEAQTLPLTEEPDFISDSIKDDRKALLPIQSNIEEDVVVADSATPLATAFADNSYQKLMSLNVLPPALPSVNPPHLDSSSAKWATPKITHIGPDSGMHNGEFDCTQVMENVYPATVPISELDRLDMLYISKSDYNLIKDKVISLEKAVKDKENKQLKTTVRLIFMELHFNIHCHIATFHFRLANAFLFDYFSLIERHQHQFTILLWTNLP